MVERPEDVLGMDTMIAELVAEISEAIYINQLPPYVAKARRADMRKILLKGYGGMKEELNDLTRRLYIAEKAVEDSKL